MNTMQLEKVKTRMKLPIRLPFKIDWQLLLLTSGFFFFGLFYLCVREYVEAQWLRIMLVILSACCTGTGVFTLFECFPKRGLDE